LFLRGLLLVEESFGAMVNGCVVEVVVDPVIWSQEEGDTPERHITSTLKKNK
jgi:hypothetical protein